MGDPISTPNHEVRFSPEFEQILREAGWYPGRSIPISEFKKWLIIGRQIDGSGYFETRMFSAAWRFLREFGGLKIPVQWPDMGLVYPPEPYLITDPLLALEVTQDYNWPLAEWESNSSLFPIARYDSRCIVIDLQGNIFDVDNLNLFGRTAEESLQNMITCQAIEDIEVDSEVRNEAGYIFPYIRERIQAGPKVS